MRYALLALSLLASLAAPARAQAPSPSGPFTRMGSWYLHPATGSNGVTVNGVTLTFDTDGNGLVNPPDDHTHARPAPFASGVWNYRLSPSRQHLYVFGAPSPNTCPLGTTVYLYRIPASDGAPLQLLTGPRCIARGIAFEGFFDQPGLWSTRTLGIVEISDPLDANRQRVHWIDLTTGTAVTSFPSFNRAISEVDLSPSGEVAYLQYDTSDGDALADYAIVCLAAGSLGQVVNLTGFPLSQVGAPFASASLVEVSGTPNVRVFWPNASTVFANVPVGGCVVTNPPPPPTGACCLPAGGCLEGVSAADCGALGGAWRASGSLCATAACPPPPVPVLGVTLAGPATVQRPQSLAWTIGWSNTGTLAANDVSVVDLLPAEVTFVSATNGGAYDPFTREVRFTLPALAAGASGSATITAQTSCSFGATVTNGTFTIRAGTSPPVAGAPPVVTTLISPPTNPVTITTTSTPLAAPPLGDDAQIEHTITVTETSGIARDEVRVQFAPGPETTLGAVVDSAGGTVRPVFGTNFAWAFPLPAGASRTLRVRTVVSSCRTGEATSTALNNGLALLATNVCGNFLGFTPNPAAIALAAPSVSVELFPNAGTQPATHQRVRAAAVRPGSTLDLELRVRNSSATARTVDAATLTVPIGLSCADPPFIGPPPAGAVWDAPTQTLTWSGSLGANAWVVIPIRATLGGAGGGQSMTATLRLAGCNAGPTATLHAVAVSPTPGSSHVLQLTSRGVVRAVATAPGALSQSVIECPVAMISFTGGLARSPNGDLWVAGTPTFRVNPTTLAFEYFPSLLTKLDLDSVNDVAIDPVDSALVFCGYKLTNRLGVRRWQRTTDIVTAVYTATPGAGWSGAKHVVVGADRAIACETSVGVLRIPFGGSPVLFDQPAIIADPAGIAIDSDGHYVVADGTGNAGPRRIAKVDRTSGAFTTLTDAGAWLPAGSFWQALALAPDGDVFVGDVDASLAVVHRPSLLGEAIAPPAPPLRLADLVHVGAVGRVDAPGVPPAPRALALAPPAPNPTRGPGRFEFALPRAGHARLAVLDVTGRERAVIVDGVLAAGVHAQPWNGADRAGRALTPGLYFVRLSCDAGSRTQKWIVAP